MPANAPPAVADRWRDTLGLSARTLALLASRPLALAVVESVWVRLAELEAAGHPAGLLAAVRFALLHHQPTRAGRCRACRRQSWRGLWRQRPFPCAVWRQIRGELLGHLTITHPHQLRTPSRQPEARGER